ncbi:MAG: amidohydrolase [Alkalibacterium sp.]|nr:amidohydrolase [Alkalibacterium sp.]
MTDLLETAIKHRRYLHQIPELSFNEFKTTTYIRDQLTTLGIPYFDPLDTATVVYFEGTSDSNETIGFRADIDALPILEETALPFASMHKGVMHACGHDGHASILLTFAEWLKGEYDAGKLKTNVLLIFQPSEESNAGADALIRAFPFEDYSVKKIFGLHLGPDIPEGILATKPGFLMASATEYRIRVKGLSAHVAQKNNGSSALGAVTQIATQLSQVQHYFLNGLNQNILHIGKLSAGEAINTVATEGYIEGTIRTYEPNDLEHIKDKMEEITKSADTLYGTSTELTVAKGYPAVNNSESLIETVSESCSRSGLTLELLTEPYLFGEDFSFYSAIAETNFAFLGARNEEKNYVHGLHTPRFNFDETILEKGVHYYQSLLDVLGAI